MRWADLVARAGDRRGVYRVLVGNPEEKTPLGRPSSKLGDNIKTNFQQVGWRNMSWIDVAQDRERCQAVVNAAMNPPVL
jgi:hypothetical protein